MKDRDMENLFTNSSDIPADYSVGSPQPKPEPEAAEEPKEAKETPQSHDDFNSFKSQYEERQQNLDKAINQLSAGMYMLLQQGQQQQAQYQQQTPQAPATNPQEVSEALLRGDLSPLQQTLVAPLEQKVDKAMGLLAQALTQINAKLGLVENRTSNPDMVQTLSANQQRVKELESFGVVDQAQQYSIIKSELAKRPQTPNTGRRGSERPGGAAGTPTRTANTWEEQLNQEFNLYQNGQAGDMALFPVGKFRT